MNDLQTKPGKAGKHTFSTIILFPDKEQILFQSSFSCPFRAAGELYEEENRGRDRIGQVSHKRQVDTAGSELRKIFEKGTLLVRSGDGSWGLAEENGGAGSLISRHHLSGTAGMNSDTLVVGFRATRPIMELAWRVLGEKPSMSVPRDGAPVQIIPTRSMEETIATAVVSRYKADADRVFEALKSSGILHVRRHERDDFSFEPGIVVTNAHQVKGLEFSAVLILNPSTGQYRDDHENRMLLHVAITRAADHLWVVGHQPMAYGLDASAGF